MNRHKLGGKTTNKYLLIGIVGLLALSMWGMASSHVPCSDPIKVNPGETVILNGTEVPPVTNPPTTVEYAWTFLDSTNVEYPIVYHINDTTIPQPFDGAYLNFSAPAEDGCYKAYLTVTFAREVKTGETVILDEVCVSYDCFEICVNKTACPLCDKIFCWEVAPTDCKECPSNLSLQNFSSGLTVWYNVTKKSDGSPVHNFSDCGDSTCDGKVCINWQDSPRFTNETYNVTLNALGPDGVLYYECSGVVSLVETPVADIRREANP